MRDCGGCTLCCTVIEVKFLGKPAGKRCPFCEEAIGCNIFGRPERPAACGAYRCAWLFNATWPDELRPDRCGAVFEPFGLRNFAAAIDPNRPGAWRKGAAREAILKMIGIGYAVVVVAGNRKDVLLPSGRTPKQVWDDLRKALDGCRLQATAPI